MKKRRLLIPLLALLCLLFTLALASCGEKHTTHTLIRHAETAPTCADNGYLEYWECTGCQKLFPNSNATAELADLETMTIPALHKDKVVHHTAVAADCDSAGNVEYWECTACNKYFSNENTTAEIADKHSVVIAATNHNGTLSYHAAVAATCDSAGTIEYWECTACHKLFSDAAATVSITQSQTVSPAEHSFDANYYCAACDWQKGTDGLEYTLSGDGVHYSVTGIGTASGDIVITNRYEGKPVTRIGSFAFSYCSSLTTITIPASVTSIGANPFSGCSNLTALTVQSGNTAYYMSGNCLIERESKTLITGFDNSVIPTDGSVTSIGSYAFEYCRSLTTITIPASVTSIGDRAFYGCYSLSTVSFGKTAN